MPHFGGLEREEWRGERDCYWEEKSGGGGSGAGRAAILPEQTRRGGDEGKLGSGGDIPQSPRFSKLLVLRVCPPVTPPAKTQHRWRVWIGGAGVGGAGVKLDGE